MPGRSGYTGEGWDSVMSWPCDEASSSSVDMIVRDFDDPECLRCHDKATQVDAEKIDMEKNLRLHLEVTRQRLLIDDLEEQVRDKKIIVQQLRNDKIQQASYLAFQDAVIEELEAKVEKINKMLHNKTR